MNGPEDKLQMTAPKDIVAAGKSARILDGRLPDSFYQSGGVRLDSVALTIINQFDAEIENLEQAGVANFESFYEKIARGEYFKTFQEYATRLGLTLELDEILSRNKDSFKRAHGIFIKMQNQESINPSEVQETIKSYKDFLAEIKALFEHFRDTVPEIL